MMRIKSFVTILLTLILLSFSATAQKQLFDSIGYTLDDAKVVQMSNNKTHYYKHWLNHLPGLIIWNGMRRLLNLGQKVA